MIISGTTFLWLYSGALALLVLISLFARRPARGHGLPIGSLQDEHWALLIGGRRRAAETIFTRQLVQGSIVWNEAQGCYESTHADPVESVPRLLRDRLPFKEVMQQVENSLKPYEEQLERWGLLLTQTVWENRKFRLMLAYIILIGIGVGRVAIGITRDRPVGFLVMLLFGTIGFYLLLARDLPRITREGRNLLDRFHRDHDHTLRAPPHEALPIAVAANGLFALTASPYTHLIWSAYPDRMQRIESTDGAVLYIPITAPDSAGGGDADGGGSGCGGCGGGD